METPLKIGQQEFQRGLGTHANSEIILRLPTGAKAFRASVGIDNNSDTQGQRGTAQFSVEIGDREVFRTPTLKGGGAPVPFNVTLPDGTRAITLKVDTNARWAKPPPGGLGRGPHRTCGRQDGVG